ncbi:MAG: FliM/FliN family flagellar motor switch protein [Defluviitaleaceae bacterium]|nr:FliM/FliN family flagellar motor switch protein [Defluviitaleaceae bacterium]
MEKKITRYDFAKPQKISKDQLRALETIHYTYCKTLATFLTGHLRISVDAKVVSAKQITYGDLFKALTNPCILSIMEVPPLKGLIIQELSANVGCAIIDRILGGPGAGVMSNEDFTEIEKNLLEKRVAPLMLMPLSEAWEDVTPINPGLQHVETNSKAARIMASDDVAALVDISIKVGAVEGFMKLYIPIDMLKPIFDILVAKQQSADIDGDGYDAVMEVVAVIGRTRMMVSDFANLAVDDIIPLDSFIGSDLEIFVGSSRKFRAKPGASRGKNAIQITSVVEMEE